jgi:L-asparaginase
VGSFCWHFLLAYGVATVYIAYTGGTIGMAPSERGYVPAPGALEAYMAEMPELGREGMPAYTVSEYAPLKDSADMTPRDWERIGADIDAHYGGYDGFIILHGTDTMAYSASALSFMLEDLAKPVIFTGSQLPLIEVRSDGRENLITSLLIAGSQIVPEVCLYFGNRLYRGNRTTKVSAGGFDAFASPNLLPLGEAGVSLAVHWERVRPAPTGDLRLQTLADTKVGALRLFPGITARLVENVLKEPLQGLVLETYGAGNAPSQDRALLEVLERASARGVVIVNCTQCLTGAVAMEEYATGRALKEAGVVSGHDMTAEAALAKLLYLFSRYDDAETVRGLMGRDLRGELTEP